MAVEVSEPTAAQQLARIHDQMKQLCRHPGIGAPREQFAKGLRVGFKSPYAIYYVATATELAVSASCMVRGMPRLCIAHHKES